MKTLIYILLFAATLSCNEDDSVQMGCQTGILKGSANTNRVTIRCCTQEEHLAGDNVAAGGTKLLTYYSSVQWQAIDDCSKCP